MLMLRPHTPTEIKALHSHRRINLPFRFAKKIRARSASLRRVSVLDTPLGFLPPWEGATASKDAGKLSELHPSLDTQLLVDLQKMGLYGSRADLKTAGHFLSGQAFHCQ